MRLAALVFPPGCGHKATANAFKRNCYPKDYGLGETYEFDLSNKLLVHLYRGAVHP
jgi:hypothetical protein